MVNAQFDGAGEGGWSLNGCHCPGSSVLLEQGSFSLDGMAPPCVDRAGCWETDQVNLLTVEWVTDPFVLVHAYSVLLGAMLAAMLSCVVWWSALVGHRPFGGLAQWWLIPGFQMFLVSRMLAATLDTACAAWLPGKLVALLCVLCFRILQVFRGNVKVKESGARAVMWTISLYFTIHQAMDGCGIRAAAAFAFALVIPTAAACSLTAAAFVRAITFVVDFLSGAASVQVIALVVHCWHVLGLRIRRAVCAAALTVHTRDSESLRHLELCGSAVPWVRFCGAALEAAAFASVDCVNTDVSEFVDTATVGWSCLVTTTLRHDHKGSRIAFEKAKATPRVDVVETPQAAPFLEAHGKVFLQPGPSLVSSHSLLIRALTGQTLVVRWSSDDVLHCVSERTGVPLHAFNLTLNGKCLTEEALHAMDRSSPVPLVMHGRLRGGSSSVPGDWVRSRCHIGGCWPTKTRCFRCAAPRHSAPQDVGPTLPRRESHHPGRAPKPKPAPVNPTFREPRVITPKRGGTPPATSAPSPVTTASQLDPTAMVTLLRSLGLTEDLLSQVRAAFPPPLAQSQKKEPRLLQLRGQIDSAKKHVERLERSVTHHRSHLQTCMEHRDKKLAEATQLENEYRLLTDF